jgi:peroxiredoxin
MHRSEAMTTRAVAEALDQALARLMVDESPLAARLERYALTLRELNQPFAEAADRLISRLAHVQAGGEAPQLGESLPPFMLPDESGHIFSLEDLLASGPLVVAFRRGHWCPYCQISTEALARIQAEVRETGGSIVAISPENSAYNRLLKWRAKGDFPILSDMDNGYAMSIGLTIPIDEEMRDFMTRRGRDLATYQGNGAWLLPIPATFVLDRNGVIVMRHVDPDYRVRASTEEVVSHLRALQAEQKR